MKLDCRYLVVGGDESTFPPCMGTNRESGELDGWAREDEAKNCSSPIFVTIVNGVNSNGKPHIRTK